MTMKRIVGVTAAASAAMLLTAGCSSGNDDAPDPGSSTAGATSGAEGDASKTQHLVLTKNDLPAGYQVMEVPQSELEKVAGSFSTGVETAKVTPAGCAQLSAFPDTIKATEIGYLISMKTTSVLAETVTAAGDGVASARKAATGKCAKQTIQIIEGRPPGPRRPRRRRSSMRPRPRPTTRSWFSRRPRSS